MAAELLRVEDVGGFLTKISETVRADFGFDKVSISILDEEKGVFTDHALAGYTKEEIAEMEAGPMAFDVETVLPDFNEAFKISRIAYYIPYEKQTGQPSDFMVVRDKLAATRPRTSPDAWHELDLLYFALSDRHGAMIGYMQVDYPIDGKIPSKETISEVGLFTTIAAVGIENSVRY
ncbi:MAG: hypothetical protein LUQ55_03860, partial [Methanomassiliicoccales archaeon]|nr:hypothetical protein [Methanomassiliicoccales archaeon]